MVKEIPNLVNQPLKIYNEDSSEAVKGHFIDFLKVWECPNCFMYNTVEEVLRDTTLSCAKCGWRGKCT